MATYNSSSINRLGYPRGAGVYPVKDQGTITIASNTTLGSGAPDTLPICYIPPNCWISNFHIAFPLTDGGNGLVMTLQDTLATVTTYMTNITQAKAGGIITFGAQVDAASALNMGTMYGNTARTVGTSGNAVVVWTSGVKLVLQVSTSATNTSGASALNIHYMIEFTPNYDQGV